MQKKPEVDGRLLSKAEVAELLRISPRTIDVYLARRVLPHVKLGASKNALVRFRRADVEDFIARQTVEGVQQ
jgi:excisionase family DNA binding protein